MFRIYIRRKNEIAGHTFICKSSIKEDKVAILPFVGFVTNNIISEEEWAKSQELIVDKFELYVSRKAHGCTRYYLDEFEKIAD